MAPKLEHYKTGPKKGQFKKRGRKTKRKTKSKRSNPKKRKSKRSNPTKKRRGNPVAKKKRRRRRRSGGGGGSIHKMMTKAKIFGTGALLGYAELKSSEEPDGGWMSKIPTIATIGTDGTRAVLFHLLAMNTKGKIREYSDYASVAYAGKAGLEFGRQDFKFEGIDGMGHAARGLPGPNEISGDYEYEGEEEYDDDDEMGDEPADRLDIDDDETDDDEA